MPERLDEHCALAKNEELGSMIPVWEQLDMGDWVEGAISIQRRP